MASTSFRSRVLKDAWTLIKTYGISRSEAFTLAWRLYNVVTRMRSHIVPFTYQKIDGTLRLAHGTLDLARIPAAARTGETRRRPNNTVQVYWDLEKCEWRCFKKRLLLSVGLPTPTATE